MEAEALERLLQREACRRLVVIRPGLRCRKAAAAVGGGFLSVDLLEHPDGLLVNELNYTPEFHGFMDATGIDVADQVIDYVDEIATKPAVA